MYMNNPEYSDANLLPVSSFAYVFTTATNIPTGAVNTGYIVTIGIADNIHRVQFYLPPTIGFFKLRYNLRGSWTEWENFSSST